MTKYYPEPDGKSFPQIEQELLEQWEREGLLAKVKNRMDGGRPLVFCEGPPTANAKPHIGHALTRAVKDAFLRYHVMNGRKIVPYIGGWDCHGLPVEIEVERSLGIQNKKEIESLGVDKFARLCRESVLKYKADWETMSKRIGYMIDYDNAYLTMSPEYVESVWWSLKQLHEKGLLTKGHKVVPYCPRCGTTLSTHEVALGFRETEARSVMVKFRLKGSDLTLLAWTATPWALVGNALVAVDKEATYAVVDHSGEKFVVAADRIGAVAPGAKAVASMKGAELLGKPYEPLFNYHDYSADGWKVVHSTEAFREEGTGVMSVSPAYGSVDYELSVSEGVEAFDPLDDEGRFTEEVPEMKGKLARDSDSELMRLLEARGLLFRWALIRQSNPYCWRCDSGLIYKAIDSWFVDIQGSKQRILALNDEIRWVPESFKHGRFGNFLADAKDWAISRSRYWGIPLPIWRCVNKHEVCVGSYDELAMLSGAQLASDFDPHRPSIDTVPVRCPECGEGMHREDFVVDCWYDSGCAPFAQYHYPFENMEEFDTHKSVDFIAEGIDQTRGWFYTQLALGALLFDQPAYKSVLVLGQVLDEQGRKIKRGAENVVYPEQVFSSVGADATRLLFLGSPVWQNVQFSEERVREEMAGTLNTLLNVYAFFVSNANAYGFRAGHEYGRTHDLDRWIVSRLHSTTKECREGFEGLEVHRAVKSLDSFIEDLSNWYVRRSRRRFWEENDPLDRFSAHSTLYDCLVALSKLMAPVTPFFSDWMYRNLKGHMESVHLEQYPEVDDNLINGVLERQISMVQTAVMAGRLARQKVNMKLRQPLPEVVIAVDPDNAWTLRRFEKMIAEELNVKRVEVLESRDKMIQYAVHPNLKTLGPKLKGSMSDVSDLLAKVDENEFVKHIRTTGRIRIGGFTFTEEDVLVTEKEKIGYSHASIDDVHVYVALELTQNLKLEGLSREVIRRIQQMRKEQKLEFEDPVAVEYSGHPDLEVAISSHREHIMREVHASSIIKKESPAGARKWVINKMPLEVSVRRTSP